MGSARSGQLTAMGSARSGQLTVMGSASLPEVHFKVVDTIE